MSARPALAVSGARDPSATALQLPATPPDEQRALRSALGRFATGVTVNSFTSLSLDPALVLWTLRSGSTRYATFAHCGLFSISVLADNQVEVARCHARPAEGIEARDWRGFRSGCPVVEGAAVQFVCRSRNVMPQGDHAILIGEVVEFADFDRKPLLFVDWWLFRQDLSAGTLVEILKPHRVPGRSISVLYAPTRFLPKKIRVMIDFLVEITKTDGRDP